MPSFAPSVSVQSPGAWALQNVLATGLTKGDAGVYVQNPNTGGTARDQHKKNLDYVTSADFGTLAASSDATNRTAIQAAIDAYATTANVYARITNPPDVSIGHVTTTRATWPYRAGVTKPYVVTDYGPGKSYAGFPTAYDGAQVRNWAVTPQTTVLGMHDGNTWWWRAEWAPNICIGNDMDLSGARLATDNRRASYTIFNDGNATYRVAQGTISSAVLSSEELSNFVIEKYAAPGDTLGGYNILLVERKTGNMGFGGGTNSPGASYIFKSISTGYYQGVFESLTTTSELYLRTSNGTGDDAGLRNTAGALSLRITTQGDAVIVEKANRRVTIAQTLLLHRVVQAYSASITIDASTANIFTITPTNGTAFTINAPTNPGDGQLLWVRIINTTGGILGVATWNAAFRMTAWVQPLTGFERVICFEYDTTKGTWGEISRTAADVPI